MVASNVFAPVGNSTLEANDDSYSGFFDITPVFESGVNFFGRTYTGLYVNNNGNVTFGNPLSQYTPSDIGGSSQLAIIAPFWGDVDTRAAGSLVTYGLNQERQSFVATWANVDYYNAIQTGHASKFNSFQLELTDLGNGNFDIIFRYGALNWTTGDASGGMDGLGGNVSRAGFSSGDGVHYFELPQSGSQAGMLGLNGTVMTGLSEPGVWQFEVRSGEVVGVGSEQADSLLGDDRDNFMDGRSGNDRLEAGAGNDYVLGGRGNDVLVAGHGQGNDFYDGGSDIDALTFTSTTRGVNVNLALGFASGEESNNDTIMNIENVVGGRGRDRIFGDSQNNRLSGQENNDTMGGGAGADIFVFNTKLGTAKTDRKVNFDKISDFNVRDDAIWLDNAIFKKLGRGSEVQPSKLNKGFFEIGSAADDRNDYLLYNSKTGILSYDADGSGSKAAIEFAQLSKNLKLTYRDFLIV
jgi:Ca2+-binding RTX toxin-like protein